MREERQAVSAMRRRDFPIAKYPGSVFAAQQHHALKTGGLGVEDHQRVLVVQRTGQRRLAELFNACSSWAVTVSTYP